MPLSTLIVKHRAVEHVTHSAVWSEAGWLTRNPVHMRAMSLPKHNIGGEQLREGQCVEPCSEQLRCSK
jgi:hypothetical protein